MRAAWFSLANGTSLWTYHRMLMESQADRISTDILADLKRWAIEAGQRLSDETGVSLNMSVDE